MKLSMNQYFDGKVETVLLSSLKPAWRRFSPEHHSQNEDSRHHHDLPITRFEWFQHNNQIAV